MLFSTQVYVSLTTSLALKMEEPDQKHKTEKGI